MNEIDEIRRQMAQIRHDLHQDVSNVVSGVSEVVTRLAGSWTGGRLSVVILTRLREQPWRLDT